LEINLNNPKGASFKENHLMTTARDALRTTSIFRFSGSFEITSIRLYTPLRNPLRGLHGVYNLIEVISSWTEQKLRSILKYIYYEKGPKGASFKENNLMTTARDALRTTSIFRFRTLTNNLNFLNQSKHV
jgi:hypothetical protein